MAFLPTNATSVQAFAGALYGLQIGTGTMTQVNNDITSFGGLNNALNAYYSASFGSTATATVAANLVANIGISAANSAAAVSYVTGVLNATAASARGAAVMNILNQLASLSSDATFGADATAWNTKVANSVAYTGSTDAAVGTAVTSTFTLTTSVDTIVGTSGNDTINATNTSTSAVLGALDSVDGGAGTDTLNIADTVTASNADFFLPVGFTVKNVEVLNVTTNGAIGKGGTTNFDISATTGLTSFTGIAAGTGSGTGSQVKAAGTTDVTLTVAGSDTATITGGKAVKVNANSGAVSVTGSALTTVNVTKGGGATIDNVDSAASSGAGTTMTAVTLGNDANSTVKGKAIASIDLSGQGAGGTASTITVTNSTASHALTVNANGTGYQNNAAATEKQTVVTDTVATSLTVNTTAKSSIDASNSTAVKSVTLTGAGALSFASMGATTTSIDGSAATGSLALGTLNAAAVTVKTGAGADTLTLSATAKATLDTGAGNDTVTLGAILAAGSTVTLGAGDDVLLGTNIPAASTATAVTVIDAGDGTDSVASTLINAGNAAQFKNFERISIGNATVDASLMTASTITGLSIDGSTGTGVLTGVTQSQSLTVNANNGGTSSTLTFSGVSGTADAYSITFNAKTTGTAASPATVDAKIVSIEGIESVTVNSGSAAGVNANAIALKDAAAKTLVITGNQALTVTFDTAFGTTGATTGVSSIDASAATGGVSVNLANVAAAAAGITVTAGAGKDTLTTSTFASTLVGGAGADTFDAQLAVTTAATAPVLTTISDAASGDVIKLTGAGTAAFTSTKVDVSTATALSGGTTNALDLASTAAGNVNNQVKWFQYGGNTYVIDHVTSSTTAYGTGDQVVKIIGLVDLSTATFADGGTFATLTLA